MEYGGNNKRVNRYINLGNYIRDDTEFILKDNFRQFRHQLLSISFYPKIVKNYRKLGKIFFRNKNTLRYKNYNKSIVIFVFALMKCSYAAFGEQNKTDNESKCQQVYKLKKIRSYLCIPKIITNFVAKYKFVFSQLYHENSIASTP